GSPDWDGITPDVRHYEISQYLLDGWAPVLRTHGYLLLLRRDLLTRGVPVPDLIEPPQTADLWFSSPDCEWGATPNFLPTVGTGSSRQLAVTPAGQKLLVSGSGWVPMSGDPAHDPSELVVAEGGTALFTTTLYQAGFHFSGLTPTGHVVTVY